MNQPLVYLGYHGNPRLLARMKGLGWGRMASFEYVKPYPGERWGFDNGAFSHWVHGEEFDETAYLRRLDRALKLATPPSLAVIPDIVAGGSRSLDFSLAWLERLPVHFPWYLALQDGMDEEEIRGLSRTLRIAGLFLGGSDQFKAGLAWRWRDLARDARLKFHYARCGTPRKLLHARRIEADSIDSTTPLWSKERFEKFVKHWEFSCRQQSLFETENGARETSGAARAAAAD